jgi:hypothetical protein
MQNNNDTLGGLTTMSHSTIGFCNILLGHEQTQHMGIPYWHRCIVSGRGNYGLGWKAVREILIVANEILSEQ